MRALLQRHRWRLLAVAGIGVPLAISAALLIASQPTPLFPGPATETPPQAPVSASEPTLAAVAATAGPASQATPLTTEEAASPFAGIAELPAQPPGRQAPVHHAVTEGEVLWQIAEQYNLRPETILWANNIQDPDLLLVGQDLVIPPSDGVMYTVRPGDSLADIANRYGVDFDSILSTNQIEDPNQVQAGVDIFLPGGRPLAATATASTGTEVEQTNADQAEALAAPPVPLPDNIDALLASGWLAARQVTNLYKTASASSPTLDQLPGGARLERVSGVSGSRIQVRDPGDGRTRQAMTGWVDATDVDVGRAPATRQLPQSYPSDTAMDISQVFAPYRSQLDGSAYAEANCGPTAIGMAMDAFGVSLPARTVRSEALDAQHMYGNNVGTLITALAAVVQENGLSAYDLHDETGALRRWTLDNIRAHLQVGRPVVVQVRYRSLPGRGGAYYFGDHYILVTGILGDGFLYNDPIDIDGLGWDRVISGAALQVAMNASDARYAYSAFAVGR